METLSRLVFTFLLNAFWQVSLVTALTAIAAHLVRNAAARYRHALWVIGLGFAILLPLMTLPESWRLACQSGVAGKAMPRDPAPTLHQPQQAAGFQAAAQNPVEESSTGTSPRGVSRLRIVNPLRRHSRSIALPPGFTYAALGIYLLVVAGQVIRLARAWASAARLRGESRVRRPPARLAGVVLRCQEAMGLGTVTVSTSSKVRGPATVGFFRPVILLPETLLQSGLTEELITALCHEMAHVRRLDYLVNLLCEFVLLPIAFHPASWLLKRRIEETRELACDEAAAGVLLSAPEYARSLVNLAQTMAPLSSDLSPRYTLGVFDANILEERIMRLLGNRPQASPRRSRLLLGGATLALALAALAAGMFSLTAVGTAKTPSPLEPLTDFSGRWELNKSQSELPSPFHYNLVEVIDQHGSDFRVTTTSKDWNTDKPIAVSLFALMLPEFSTTTDNKETVQPFGPGQIRSKTHWEGNDLASEWTLERNGQVAVTGRWVRNLSSDRNTQTIQITAHDPVHNLDGAAKAVFVRREENPRAFLGAWHGEFQGEQFVTLNLKSEGNRVTGAMSDFDVRIDLTGNILEATPGTGGGWEIVEARLYNGALHMKCKEAETGEIDAFGLKLLDGGKAELELAPPPGNPAPKPLILARDPAKNQGANAVGEQDRRAFLGTWRGLFSGKTYILLTLNEAGGSLIGAVSVGAFGINESGHVARVKEEANPRDAVPISNGKLEGDLLSFSGKTPDGGSDVLFQMKLAGGNAAELKCVLVPGPPPGTPVASWWKLVRESDDHHGVIGPGPLGGVVGNGGLHVRSGALLTRPIGGIVGGVPGGVTGGIVGGVPGGVIVGVVRSGITGGVVGGVADGVGVVAGGI